MNYKVPEILYTNDKLKQRENLLNWEDFRRKVRAGQLRRLQHRGIALAMGIREKGLRKFCYANSGKPQSGR